MTVRLYPLQSKLLEAAGYDPDSQTMYISFAGSGTTYAYHGVGAETYARLLNADSAGKHFLSIKKLMPNYTKLTPEQRSELFGDEPEANQPRTGAQAIV